MDSFQHEDELAAQEATEISAPGEVSGAHALDAILEVGSDELQVSLSGAKGLGELIPIDEPALGLSQRIDDPLKRLSASSMRSEVPASETWSTRSLNRAIGRWR